MTRHEAPNHPDCYVECRGGGFAHYVEPYGPCNTGCDPDNLGKRVVQLVRDEGWYARTSGVVKRISVRSLQRLGSALLPLAEGDENAYHSVLNFLRVLPAVPNAQIDAEWIDANTSELLLMLGGPATEPESIPVALA
jgi:hypothetical protein